MPIASSSDRHFMTDTTGPKISSRAIRIFGSTLVKTVGSWKKPWAWVPLLRRLPPHASVAPSFFPIST